MHLNTISLLWRHVDRKFKIKFTLLIFVSLLSSFLEVFSLSALISVLEGDPSNLGFPIILLKSYFLVEDHLLLIFLLLFFSSSLCRFLLHAASAILAADYAKSLSKSVFMSMVASQFSGSVANVKDKFFSTILGKISTVSNVCIFSLMQVMSGILIITIMSIYTLFLLDSMAILGVIFFVLILLSVNRLIAPLLLKNSHLISKSYDGLSKNVREIYASIPELYLYDKLKYFSNLFYKNQSNLRNTQAVNQVLSGFPRFFIEAGLCAALLVVFIGGRGFSATDLSSVIPTLGAVGFVAFRILPVLQAIYMHINNFIGSQGLIHDVLDAADGAAYGRELIETQDVGVKNEQPHILAAKNISYNTNGHELFREISFSIGQQQLIGVSGRSGSGKTTLIQILMGLKQPTTGEFYVDYGSGSVEKVEAKSLSRLFSYVPQQVQIFEGTVQYNVTLEERSTDIDLAHLKTCLALASVDIGCNCSLGQLASTYLVPDGANLSGGQVQRIGIARALYHKRPFLILDEPSSALDLETELEVFSSLRNELMDANWLRGIICVTHSQKALSLCDAVINLELRK